MSHDNSSEARARDAYSGLREMVLSLAPDRISKTPAEPNDVYGVVMETGYAKAVVTLVALADNTVSLYFSSGGGIIGLGPLPGPKRAAESLLAASRQFIEKMQPTSGFPLPAVGDSQFYLLTVSGVRTASGREEDFGRGRHPLSPLFYKGHELITEIRKVDEQRQQAGKG